MCTPVGMPVSCCLKLKPHRGVARGYESSDATGEPFAGNDKSHSTKAWIPRCEIKKEETKRPNQAASRSARIS